MLVRAQKAFLQPRLEAFSCVFAKRDVAFWLGVPRQQAGLWGWADAAAVSQQQPWQRRGLNW